jgi:hypothetical protein
MLSASYRLIRRCCSSRSAARFKDSPRITLTEEEGAERIRAPYRANYNRLPDDQTFRNTDLYLRTRIPVFSSHCSGRAALGSGDSFAESIVTPNFQLGAQIAMYRA